MSDPIDAAQFIGVYAGFSLHRPEDKSVWLDMQVSIADGGRAGVSPQVKFVVFDRGVDVWTSNSLAACVEEYNRRVAQP